jgi:hypothetical protein
VCAGGLPQAWPETPGERVAPTLLKLIDQNTDGNLDQTEVQRYAQRVLEDLKLSIDGQLQHFKLEPVVTPATNIFLAGGGTIKINARANLTGDPGSHTLEFRNAHAPVKSGYLANVFVQSGEVNILDQKRDLTQQDYQVRYSLEPRAPRIDWGWLIPAILTTSALIAWWLTRMKLRRKRGSRELAQH